jgi:hypothetical protein
VITAEHQFRLETITEPVYDWKDHSRFVEIFPVSSGWLVIWGRYEEMGAVRSLAGSRVYRSAAGARRRLAWAIVALTRNPVDARDALRLLDYQGGLPAHTPKPRAGSDPSAANPSGSPSRG